MNTNKLINKLENLFDNNWDRFLRVIFKVNCILRGVKLGKNVRVVGLPYIHIANGGNISIGDNCTFRSRKTSNYLGLNHQCILSATPAYEDSKSHLVIGNNCGMSGVSLRCFLSITIGNNVRIGANTVVVDGDAHFNDSRTAEPKAIIIEDDVFIGAYCTIKKGVTIGKGAMIGMHSLVTHDVPPYSVAVGIPAKVIRKLK